MMETDEDEEDPVTHEIDVFLSKALFEKLYLFQYPVRPANLVFDNLPMVGAKIKPKQQRVELELGLDTNNATYCEPRGEQIAFTVDSNIKDATDKYYKNDIMDKQVLSSVRATENPSRFVSGIFRHGELHLSPVHGVVQLRPSFEYLDKAEQAIKIKEKAKEGNESQDEEEEEEAKPIMLRFKQSNPRPVKEGSALSMKYFEQKNLEEPWIDTAFYSPQDPKSKAEKMLLCCHQDEFDAPEFTLTSREYLRVLAPPIEGQVSDPSAMPEGVLSLSKLKDMDIIDQVKAILVNAKSVQFGQVYALLGTDVDEQEVLRALHHFACLVQGIWMVKSDILYPAGGKSDIDGLEHEKIWSARDYLDSFKQNSYNLRRVMHKKHMWSFNNKRLLHRKDISVIRIHSEELRDILEQMARYRVQGWEFALPTDADFLARYPEIIRMQMSAWESKYKSLCQHYGLNYEPFKEGYILPGLDSCLHGRKPHRTRRSGQSRRISSGESESPTRSPQKKAPTRRSRTKSGSHDVAPVERTPINEVVDQEMKRTPNEIDMEVSRAKNVSVKEEPMEIVDIVEISVDDRTEQICDVSNQSNGVSNDSLEAFIPPVALSKEPHIVRKPPSDLFKQEVRHFVRETLRSTVLSIEEIKQVLELRQQEPGNILCAGVSDELLEESIIETGAELLEIKWPDSVSFMSSRPKFFGYRKVGGYTDRFRSVIFDLFKENFVVRRQDFTNRYKRINTEEDVKPAVFQRTIAEFCERYGGAWYLRGTFKIAFPEKS